jgi:leader peptidase (prepilin peptidase)/N-methyltransferase
VTGPWIVWLVGCLAAMGINEAIDRWAYWPRGVGRMGPAPESCPKRGGWDWLPILGWLRLRRESGHHGRGFWLRPMAVELLLPLFLLWLYRWELQGQLLPGNLATDAELPGELGVAWQFWVHAALISMLVIATCIDLDERMIPDTVTTPLTLLAVFGAAVFPDWRFWVTGLSAEGSWVVTRLHPASPDPWNPWWHSASGFQTILLLYSLWCFALADRRWILRRGWKKAWRYFLAGLVRHPSWKLLLGIWLAGLLGLGWIYARGTPQSWSAVVSSVFGMAMAGALVWSLRLVARLAMGMEAIGFGDVTLMAMVGAVLGWQPAWLAFFLGPMAAIPLVILVYLWTRDPATPLGPYLALGSLLTIVAFRPLYLDWASERLFFLGDWLIYLFVGFLFAFGLLLGLLGLIKGRWAP